jgi:ParB family chromosome partitioning protein
MTMTKQDLLFDIGDLPETYTAETNLRQSTNRKFPWRLVAIDCLEPDPDRPRKTIAKNGVTSLADTLQQGLWYPLLVRRGNSGRYMIVDGHRRWLAARQAGLNEVPVIIVTPDDPLETQLIIELHREGLDAVDASEALAALAARHQGADRALAQRIGIDPSLISRARLVAGLDEAIKTSARNRGISGSVLAELATPRLSDADRLRLLALPTDRLTRQAVRAAIAASSKDVPVNPARQADPRGIASRYLRKGAEVLRQVPGLTEQDIMAMPFGEILAMIEDPSVTS